MSISKRLVGYIAKSKFVKKAIDERADLSGIKGKPTRKTYLGVFLMGSSYILEFGAIGLFGALSIYWEEPKLIIIAGPLFFIIAHIVFFAGMYLAGGKYLMVFLRWATRITVERILEK